MLKERKKNNHVTQVGEIIPRVHCHCHGQD